ncbi:MAG: hypothetical protein H6P95_1175 [Candidatus Aminicenantes bacterium]|nr:hypothetical protein [Candidatus Aminicenantes bacterium]
MGSLLLYSLLSLAQLFASPNLASPQRGPSFAPVPPAVTAAADLQKAEDAKAPAEAAPQKDEPTPRIESWGEFEPGNGFLIGRSKAGELGISVYGMMRYINQLPPEQTFTDHFGNENPIDTRNDIFAHRFMIFLKGWLATPKLVYTVVLWTVSTTDQKAIFGVLGYQFSRKFSLYAGLNGLPGTRSIQGSHPFWLAPDRFLADEFFRPYFTNGIWAQGEVTPGLWYNIIVGNNNSALGIKATDLDRKLSYGGSVWWMPTTHEFGPRGGYGDWERHDKLATRFGAGFTQSPEDRQTSATTGPSNNTTIRLADSLNLFDTGSLAPGITVQRADYRVISVDAGVKYRGFFLHAEAYDRVLDNFAADGLLPVARIHDRGFHVQGAFFPIRQKLELYVGTSQIFGDKDAGFGSPDEYLAGANYYPFQTRNHRLNLHVINVNRSPVSSTFGYYVGGQKGTTVSLAASFFF